MPAAPDRDFLFSSESVTEGHPDKLADQISDAVLDAVLAEDPQGRVACEVLLSKDLVLVAGEITAEAEPDYESIVREVLRDVGYTSRDAGIDADACDVQVTVSQQSGDIAQGVDPGGAGDQGMMFGYATRETPEFMPLPIVLAHGLTRRLAAVRKDGTLAYLRPDGKAQVTVRYRGGTADRVTSVVLAAQHDDALADGSELTEDRLRDDVKEHVIRPVLDDRLGDGTDYYINHTGRFVIGGPEADAGLTGRKIIVDTYGGWAPHGGGAFSGKDPTKVDRSANYYTRYVAKNLVGAGVCERAQVHVAYSIGSVEPTNVTVDTFGTGVVPDDRIEALVKDVFDFSPASIIEELDLRRPIYRQTAAYGHFGRNDLDLPWERLDRVDELGEAVKAV